ncbi:MAG: hypothetical protein JW797_19385 [Bradymonadales bacterium]|nr:hypothetical protein [Bradymonadales bacterium]
MEQQRYSRIEIARLLGLEESFILALEEEQIVTCEPGGEEGIYSSQAFERIRLADTLVHELEVNLAGTAIIVRMREQLASMQQQLAQMTEMMREMARRLEDPDDSE